MQSDYSKYVCRKPRHQAAATSAFRVQIERSAAAQTEPLYAELNNLSRDGFQLRTTTALQVGESIILRLCGQEPDIDLAVPARVQWCRTGDDGLWVIGCQSVRRIDWETLGELFLGGVLATDAATDARPDACEVAEHAPTDQAGHGIEG